MFVLIISLAAKFFFTRLAEKSWLDLAAVDTKAFKAIHLINEAENMPCNILQLYFLYDNSN